MNNNIIMTLKEHKHGIGALSFSPDSKYLVTIGFKHDKKLILWDIDNNTKISEQKLSNKVNSVSFNHDGSYFVTAGDRHLKWWYLIKKYSDPDFEVGDYTVSELQGKPASILESLAQAVFTDICIGSSNGKDTVYCTTANGVLCAFLESRMMDKWVNSESSSSYCCCLFNSLGMKSLLLVGCANGVIRAFDPESLQYIATLPTPAPLSGNALKISYPACYALCKVPRPKQSQGGGIGAKVNSILSPPRLATIYADRSLLIWDISDIYKVIQFRSFSFHRACIWDIHFVDGLEEESEVDKSISSSVTSLARRAELQPLLPVGTFITCSADNSIRVWNTDSNAHRQSKWKSIYSKQMLHMIEVEVAEDDNNKANKSRESLSIRQSNASVASTISNSTIGGAGDREPLDLSCGLPDTELPDKPQGSSAPRALAVHPHGRQFVCGDKNGTLCVYDLATMSLTQKMQAHAAEILTLHYSPPMKYTVDGSWVVDFSYDNVQSEGDNDRLVMLASAGRDRLVHIYDASMSTYKPTSTLDNHSSSVTVAKFTSDGQRFLSCGGDRTMVFSTVNGPEITRQKSIQTPHGTINGLAVEATTKFAVTSGADKKLNIWNLQSGKHMRAYKSDLITSELYKCDIDPSGMYVAACSFDKTISVFDFFSGELITQVHGHSELTTAVRFSPDGRSLISTGGDGVIMIWQLSDILVTAMQDRLLELYSNAQRKQSKAAIRQRRLMKRNAKTELAKLSTESLKQKPAVEPEIAKDNVFAVNKWAAKIEGQEGYELFGRKIIPGVIEPSKLTLELEQTQASMVPHPDVETTKLATSLEESDYVNLDPNSDNEIDDIDEEEDDDEDDEKIFKQPNDGTSKVSTQEDYEDDFENDQDNDQDLLRASTHIESLEQSALDLENWLEKMIRSEGKIDENISKNTDAVPSMKIDSNFADLNVGEKAANHDEDIMSKSLSSAFFKNISTDALQNKSNSNDPDSLLPPPPFRRASAVGGNDTVEGLALEVKRRETAAAVAQMKERLRVMGILKATAEFNNGLKQFNAVDDESVATTIDDKSQAGIETNAVIDLPEPPVEEIQDELIEETFSPPPPPSNDSEEVLPEVQEVKEVISTQNAVVRISDGEGSIMTEKNNIDASSVSNASFDQDHAANISEVTMSIDISAINDVSAMLNNENSVVRNPVEPVSELLVDNKLVGSDINEEQLQDKLSEYKKVLDNLAEVRKKALTTYDELLQMRTSIERTCIRRSLGSVTPSNTDGGEQELLKSIEVTDSLISEFRHSFATFAGPINNVFSSQQLIGRTNMTRTNTHPMSLSTSTVLGQSSFNDNNFSPRKGSDDDVSMILEKYSDKLMMMVTEKVQSKMNEKNNNDK